MKPTLLLSLVLLVVAPMLLLGGMGVRLARVERQQAELRFRALMEARLGEQDKRISEYLRRVEDQLLETRDAAVTGAPAARLKFLLTGLVREYFSVSPEGNLLFPTADTPESDQFFRRTEVLWESSSLPFGGEPEATAQTASSKSVKTATQAGWHTWYWGNGLQFLYWWREASGGINGVEINRSRLVADIVALLPETAADAPGSVDEAGQIRLLDAQGQVLYQWGAITPVSGQRPLLALALSPPLQAWQLQYFPAPGAISGDGRSLQLGLLLLVAACAACVVLLAAYFYRESSREMRDAAQRVSFVNQVSHELKTPLTNIRLYAELMQEELPPEEEHHRHATIIAQESQRLSRLIGNILTFARKQRRQLRIHCKPVLLDELIAASVALQQPRLKERGLDVATELDAGAELPLDTDAFEQILYNLLSNAEKYAAKGGHVFIRSRVKGTDCLVDVCDQGPGIPDSERERIFRPFYRLGDALNEGASGTGLGLSLARELARLHGGDLVCVPHAGGACFQVRLPLRGGERNA